LSKPLARQALEREERTGAEKKRPALFRRVAIDAASGTQIGEPLDTYWRGITVFTAIAFAVVAGLIVFTVVVEYAPIYRIASYTDVAGGLVRLSAPADGQIRLITAGEGAQVTVGDVLAVLDSDVIGANGSSRQVALKEMLSAEKETIEREIQAAKEEADASNARTERLITGLRSERATLLADISSGEKLLASLRSQSDLIATLGDSGYATKIQAAKASDEVLAQQGRLASARGALSRVERDIQAAEADRRVVESKLRGLVENRKGSSGALTRQMLQADVDAERLIRAPEDGLISSELIARGQSVVSGQVLFTLMPQGEPLIIRLIIPPRAAASVKPGMQVKVVFQAYPQEKFGDFEARIDKVSNTPSMPTEIPAVYAIREPAFLAVASLVGEPRGLDGKVLPLKPGMLVDALVPIERRRVIEWLLDPLFRAFNESAGHGRGGISRDELKGAR